MNRRGFIGALAAAFVADPERLLFVPGTKLISIPAPRLALTRTPFDDLIIREALRQLTDNLVLGKLFTRDYYAGENMVKSAIDPSVMRLGFGDRVAVAGIPR